MNAVHSNILPVDGGLSPNRAEFEALIARMRQLEARAAVRSEARRAVMDRRGRMSARARLAAVLDQDQPYLELYNMASYLVDDPHAESSAPGASLLAGIGFVSGVRCVVCVDDAGINAGAMRAKTAQKLLGLIAIAKRQKLPLVHLMDSIGADLMRYDAQQWDQAGAVFAALADLSAAGIPCVAVLHGAAIGSNALYPGLADYVVGVRSDALAMLGSAAQVKATTGEVARDAALGGAELHAEVTGLVDQLAENDADAIVKLRDVVASLDWKSVSFRKAEDIPEGGLSEEILDIAAADPRVPWNMMDLITRLVDAGETQPYKPGFGPASLCLGARICGHKVAIVANNGLIDPDGARKIIRFLERAEQAGTPVVFLHNTRGFQTGRMAERAGMVQLAARMLRTMAGLKVPKLALKVGESYGPASYAMGGAAAGADFLFTWPNAVTGVLDSQTAAQTMDEVARRSARRRGLALDESKLSVQRERLRDQVAGQSDAFFTSGRGLDMGMIDPRDSRRVLAICLDTCAEAKARSLPCEGSRLRGL